MTGSRVMDSDVKRMPIDNANWWSDRKFGFISLALSFTEVFVIYGAVAWVLLSNQPHVHPSIRSLVDFAFLVGGISSLGFAVAGLAADSRRLTALIAVFVTILTFLVCGLQMLV